MITQYDDGYCIIPGAVPLDVVRKLERTLLLEIVKYGLPKETFDEYHNSKCWFPSLRDHVCYLADYVPSGFKTGTLCEPQILLHFPDEAEEYEIRPHLDEEPPWADGRKYRTIAGVCITDQYPENGGFITYGKDEQPGYPEPVEAWEGDIIVFDPKLWHSGGLNHTGEIRAMVYFRWLEDVAG